MLNPLFQVGLDVMGRRCLVVGGGGEAEDKCGRLLDAGARITLLADALAPALRAWAESGRLLHRSPPFAEADLDGVFLVLNTAAGDEALARRLWQLASARHLLINTYDRPEYSNFGMVALVRPGHLRLGIGTSNASPSLARRLRQELEKLFGDEFAGYLDGLAQARLRVRQRVADRQTRFALLRALTRGFRIEGRLHYPPHWRKHVEALLHCDLVHCGGDSRCAGCPLAEP